MKCYIATYYQYNNYGSKLQNYALVSALKSVGAIPITISIKENKMKLIKIVIRDILSFFPVTSRQKLWKNERIKKSKFKTFNTKLETKKISYKQLEKIDFSDSIAIAGSDQIWLPDQIELKKENTKLYFLEFIDKTKRFSYAPSFGVDKLPKDKENLYFNGLKEFNIITTREKEGQKIIQSLIGQNVKIMPDPVFLLSKEQWRNNLNYNGIIDNSDEYILTYFLGVPNKNILNQIESYSIHRNYKIINLAGNYLRKNDVIVNPEDFVSLIDNAKLVFTDSFHACAFSIIMNTNFFVFERNDVQQFSRINNLLEKYNLEICKLDYNFNKNMIDEILFEVNFEYHNILKYERKKGMNYLKKIIKKENIDYAK